MKKFILDLKVVENQKLNEHYALLKLASSAPLPPMRPGQFAEIRIDRSKTTFLRRPVSIHFVDRQKSEVWFLIQLVGDGTRALGKVEKGEWVNVLLPLGNGFTMPENRSEKLLLIGGGVGIAPLLYLGDELAGKGFEPRFLLGARTASDLLQLEQFSRYGELWLTTEDGSIGEEGYVVGHSVLVQQRFDRIYTCGPKPMMMAVARYAAENNTTCEVSLENRMACGIGACLCCVEDTTEGNICVCSEGPVLNTKRLLW